MHEPSSRSISRNAREVVSGHQKDFPVTNGREITGLLLNREVVKALSQGRLSQPIGELACHRCPMVGQGEPLDHAVDKMQGSGCSALLVERDGHWPDC